MTLSILSLLITTGYLALSVDDSESARALAIPYLVIVVILYIIYRRQTRARGRRYPYAR